MSHTPGPWRWELNEKSKRVELNGGCPRYDLTVMDFVRYGMGGAAPRFRIDEDRMNIMERVEKFAEPVQGREHHASWFQSIKHPDARLIEAAPNLLEALEAARDEQIARVNLHLSEAPSPSAERERLQTRLSEASHNARLLRDAAIEKAKGETP